MVPVVRHRTAGNSAPLQLRSRRPLHGAQLRLERGAAEAQQLRGPRDVAIASTQRTLDVTRLQLFERRRRICCRFRCVPAVGAQVLQPLLFAQALRQHLRTHYARVSRTHQRATDHVAQLTNVPRPFVPEEYRAAALRQLLCLTAAPRERLDFIVCQQKNVGNALTQRRDGQNEGR
jgi:hypothetical protein